MQSMRTLVWQVGDKVHQLRSPVVQMLNIRLSACLASSFTAALLDSLSKQPGPFRFRWQTRISHVSIVVNGFVNAWLDNHIEVQGRLT